MVMMVSLRLRLLNVAFHHAISSAKQDFQTYVRNSVTGMIFSSSFPLSAIDFDSYSMTALIAHVVFNFERNFRGIQQSVILIELIDISDFSS
jgi:hypothetical protein